MDSKFNIRKYIKFSLASNTIFNNSIFAGCNKKGSKENKNKGCSADKNKHTETNITNDEKTPKEETPNNPGKGKDYKKEITELLKKLSDIEKNYNYLPEKKIDLNKEDLENEIKSINSDEKVNNIKNKLNNLESELKKNLNNLKSDYNIRLNEIILGNTKLDLKININLAKEDIDNLNFDKNPSNINNVKTKLENLEKQYFDQLTSKSNDLKKKYEDLVKKKDTLIEGDKKKQVENLCNLTDKDFVIKNYIDYNNLNSKISNIENLIKGDEESLKKDLEDRYNNYSNIKKNLSLNITDFDNDKLSKQIENFKIEDFSDINDTLDQIHQSIKAKIKELNDNLEKEYNKIIEKIGLIPTEKGFTYSTIIINIDENTKEANYKNLEDSINQLQKSFDNKLNELKGEYERKINDLNAKLEGLNLEKINNNILDNLTFENLANETISNIEKSINDAETKCNTKVEEFIENCTNSLNKVKTDYKNDDILNITDISNSIKVIEENIKKIDDETKKNEVNKLISDLKKKIEGAKKKKAEEEAKKKKEEERQEIIKSFKSGHKIEGSDKLTIKLDNKKFKLYFNETILIAETETEINENNIEKIDEYKNSQYTIILSFAGRYTHKITKLKIDDIINNIKNEPNKLKDIYSKINHCFLKLNYTYNGDVYTHFYDVNTGYLFSYNSNCYKNDKKISVSFGLFLEKKESKIYGDIKKAYYNGKYGKLVNKNSNWYFEENSNITDINDKFSTEEIKTFSKISL